MNIEHNTILIKKLRDNIGKVIIGKEETLDFLITALIAEGHVLLEDLPGTGKTILARSLAKSLDGKFSRIQFTPDLLPSDITGINYYNQKNSEFSFKKGPVFTNILLADEINRATPRTQSALLESMEEKQVTVDGVTRILEKPFFVIATQNPVENSGTFPLPEAQLDRFMMKLSVGVPDLQEEIDILSRFLQEDPINILSSVMESRDLTSLQEEYKNVYIHPDLIRYLAEIAVSTRRNPDLSIGISPRGTLAALKAIRAFAMVKGRDFVIPEDIKELAVPVFAHRVSVPQGILSAGKASEIINSVLETVKVPSEEWRK